MLGVCRIPLQALQNQPPGAGKYYTQISLHHDYQQSQLSGPPDLTLEDVAVFVHMDSIIICLPPNFVCQPGLTLSIDF